MSETQTTAKPRIILEQQDDGTIVIEHYINGARTRVPVAQGMLNWEIAGALGEQRNNLMAQRERQEAKRKQEEIDRHNRVYTWTAEAHGVAFANRTVGIAKTRIEQKPKAAVISVQRALANLA